MRPMQDFHSRISAIVQKALPAGVHFYGKFHHAKGTYYVIFTDSDFTTKYFEKEYSRPISMAGSVVEEILKDVADFNEYWNSPLMKALRDEI